MWVENYTSDLKQLGYSPSKNPFNRKKQRECRSQYAEVNFELVSSSYGRYKGAYSFSGCDYFHFGFAIDSSNNSLMYHSFGMPFISFDRVSYYNFYSVDLISDISILGNQYNNVLKYKGLNFFNKSEVENFYAPSIGVVGWNYKNDTFLLKNYYIK